MLSAGACDVGRAWKIPPFFLPKHAMAPILVWATRSHVWKVIQLEFELEIPSQSTNFPHAHTSIILGKKKTSKIWFKWQLCYTQAHKYMWIWILDISFNLLNFAPIKLRLFLFRYSPEHCSEPLEHVPALTVAKNPSTDINTSLFILATSHSMRYAI